MDSPLVLDVIHSTKSMLCDIRDLSRLTRNKFVDKYFEEFFYAQISGIIEQIDLLLDGFLNYVKSTAVVTRKDAVGNLIEKAVENNQHLLQEKKIRIIKRLEKELPETVVPDEQMAFILDSIVRYAAVLMPSGGDIIFSTKSSFVTPEPFSEATISTVEDHSRRIVEISAVYKGSYEQRGMEVTSWPREGEASLSLVLRLVSFLVSEHNGTMEYDCDETKARGRIVLRFLSERRQGVHYQPTDS